MMSRIDDLIAEQCPDGVEMKTLRDIGTWFGGGTPSKLNLGYWRDGTIPWLSPKDMGRPIMSRTEDYITEAAVSGSATKLVPASSVAVVVRLSIVARVLPTARGVPPRPSRRNRHTDRLRERGHRRPQTLDATVSHHRRVRRCPRSCTRGRTARPTRPGRRLKMVSLHRG